MSQEFFWNWIERYLPDVLGFPVFSIGQEVLFDLFGQIVLAEVEAYVISTHSNGEMSLQYWLLIHDNLWGDAQDHEELLKLNPIANNLPRYRS